MGTDYYARKRLVTQDKNKFGTPKYRFVVRFTNKDIICQVVSSKIKGDVCHAAAYAHELPRYGLSVGLTNYSKIFSAMKGAFDGGLEIPHSEKKFYGYDPDEKSYDAESNRERILGGHVAEYMTSLQEEEPEEYEEKFKKYIEAGIDADNMEETYLSVHKKVRESPEAVKTEKKKPSAAEIAKQKNEGGIRFTDADGKEHFINQRRRTLAQRKNRVAQKKAFVLSTLADDSAEEEDEE